MEQLFSLFLMFLKITGQFFCRLLLNFSLFALSLQLHTAYVSWQEISQRDTVCLSVCVIKWYMILIVPVLVMLNMVTWLRCYMSGLSPIKLFFFLLNNFTLWKVTLQGCNYPILYQTLIYIDMFSYFICHVMIHY